MAFAKLTMHDGDEVYVNPNSVCLVTKHESKPSTLSDVQFTFYEHDGERTYFGPFLICVRGSAAKVSRALSAASRKP